MSVLVHSRCHSINGENALWCLVLVTFGIWVLVSKHCAGACFGCGLFAIIGCKLLRIVGES